MNKVMITRRLTRDPELRFGSTDPTNSIANFAVAVNRKYANKNGERETDFFNCVAYGKTADFVKNYFIKGSRIALSGRVQNRNWDDDQGVKHYVTEIIAEDVDFVDTKAETDLIRNNNAQNETAVPGYQPANNNELFANTANVDSSDFGYDSENDLPF